MVGAAKPRGGTSTANRPWPVTVTVPTGSPWTDPVTCASISAPNRSRISRKPIRPGFSDTSGVVTDEPRRSAAADHRKAALDGSPGIRYSVGGTGPGSTRKRPGPAGSPNPSVASHRSVWSR